jgi:tRNA threonylcarbamoyladenosine biosynthesis protein TsaB
MCWILNIDTSSSVCSVALAKNGRLISIRESEVQNSHASLCTIFTNEVIEEAGISFKELSAVAISEGPGSYTGLRIGTSVAKGICFAADIPLIAVPTLRAMTEEALEKYPDKTALYIPMTDARRMEVYRAVYDHTGKELSPAKPEILDERSFTDYDENQLYFFGNGSVKAQGLLKKTNSMFLNIFGNSAKNMLHLSQNFYNKKNFVHISSFEPKYLKLFQNVLE